MKNKIIFWEAFNPKANWHKTATQPNNSEWNFEEFEKHMSPVPVRKNYEVFEYNYICNDCGYHFDEDIIADYNRAICSKCFSGDVEVIKKVVDRLYNN